MSTVKLQRMKLENFKGIREFTLEPSGADISIYGDNATGKTTLMDGFLWCLFGKDSLGQAAFEIKGLDDRGQADSGLDHTVEVQLSIDGKPYILSKTLREKWVKKRGAASREFTGHEIQHQVDGVPVQKRQFDEAVSRVCDEKLFRLLANPRHFNEVLHWQERRALLLTVCGDMSDRDVIDRDPQLSELPAILGDRKLDDHLKVLRARRAEINKELDEIPVRIDEAENSKAKIDVDDPKSLNATLVQLRGQRADIEAQIVRIQSGGELGEKKKALVELEGQLLSYNNAAYAALETDREKKRRIIDELRNDLSIARSRDSEAKRNIADLSSQIDALNAKIVDLRTAWNLKNEEQWTASVRCPTCGQSLPYDQIEESRSRWNEAKAETLKAINAEGKGLAAKISELKDLLSQAQSTIESTDTILRDLQSKIEQATSELEAIKPAEDDPKRAEIIFGINMLKSNISELILGTNDEQRELQSKSEQLTTEIRQHEAIFGQIENNNSLSKRIIDLKAAERRLAGEFEKLERELALCERFIRTKVSLTEANINTKFEMAGFRLFRDQINGGLEECCETTVAGIPYGSLNNAARINVGIDIANALAKHYDISLPMWIDNAEAVSEIIPSVGQQIRLYVSAAHPQLTIGGSNGRI